MTDPREVRMGEETSRKDDQWVNSNNRSDQEIEWNPRPISDAIWVEAQ
jgi:hypothetical protein